MKIETEIQTNFSSPQHKAIVNIRYTSNYLGNIQNNFIMEFDLTMAQFNILRILRGAKGEITVNTIKERMIERSPNTTRLMDKLVEKELIERSRSDEDRRVVYVKISEAGLALLAEIDQRFKGSSFMPTGLSDKEANQLSDLLDKMRENVK